MNMKNIIPITTLLVAGTALANAAVVTWSELDGSASATASGDSVQSWDVSTTGLTWTGTRNTNNTVVSSTPESVIFSIDFSQISSSLSYNLFSIKDGSYNGLSAIAIKGGNINFFTWNGNDATTTQTLSLSDSSILGSDILTFVFSRDASVKTSLSIYTGTSTVAAATLDGRTNFGFVGINWSQLNFGGKLADYFQNVDSVMPTNVDASPFTLLGAGYTLGSVATEADLQSYYAAALPEPSAFGLLAGIGALALVAARRRRSKKA